MNILERTILAFCVLASSNLGATPQLRGEPPASIVVDLATAPDGPAFVLGKIEVMGDLLIFPGIDDLGGKELWASDGTSAGTYQLADICAGRCGSLPSLYAGYSSQGYFIRGPIAVGDEVFFEADDGVHGHALWRSDGSTADTRSVDDFDSYLTALHGIDQLVGWHDRAYFVAADHDHGPELRRAGGPDEGMALVKDIAQGEGGSEIDRLVAAPAALFFSAFEDGELWTSDGTEAGTRSLLGLVAIGGGSIEALFIAGDGVLFTIRNAAQERTLWISDGTDAGTFAIQELGIRSAANLIASDGQTYFQVQDLSDASTQLWLSDGTKAGTSAVVDTPGFILGPAYTKVLGSFYYAVDEELWKLGSDGNASRIATFGEDIDEVAGAGDGLFVTTGDNRLWWSANTTGPFHSADISFPFNLTPFQDRVLFYSWTEEAGSQIASIDSDGEVLVVTDFSVSDSSDPSHLLDHETTLLFSNSLGLFASRGTAASTIQIGNLSPPVMAASAGETAFALEPQKLWSFEEGASPDLLIEFGNLEITIPATRIEYGGRLFFGTLTPGTTQSFALWESDGTAGGSLTVDSFQLPEYDCGGFSNCRLQRTQVTQLEGLIILLLENKLYRSNGIAGGATEIFDVGSIGGGCETCSLDHLTRVGNRVFFTSAGLDEPSFLWITDGTSSGTRMVKELAGANGNPLSLFSRFEVDPLPPLVQEPLAFGERLFFVLRTRQFGEELWASDGTPFGTQLVVDLRSGPGASYPRNLTATTRYLFFAADDGSSGHELWATDGHDEGTFQVADILAGSRSSFPGGLTPIESWMVFAARDEEKGLELWQSAGTSASTRLVQDLQPGSLSADPRYLVLSGDRLFFNAGSDETGFELWSASLSGISMFEDGFESGDVSAWSD